jgi:hypothetical protein
MRTAAPTRSWRRRFWRRSSCWRRFAEIRATRPLATVMSERIAALRAWASERTVPAD